MTDKEGTLRMMASGRWAVCRPGETPHEIRALQPLFPGPGALSDVEPTAWGAQALS